jgi:hypothetical protein
MSDERPHSFDSNRVYQSETSTPDAQARSSG